MKIQKILIVGAGTMGRGIAQWFCQSGTQVYLMDSNQDQIGLAISYIKNSWKKLLDKGKFTEGQIKKFENSLFSFEENDDYSQIDLVIEAIIEDLSLKKEFFNKLSSLLSPNTLIASNTSSFPISQLAQDLSKERQKNFFGLHFFNPATIMKLVEIIPGAKSSPQVISQVRSWLSQLGKKVVTSADRPGFIVNRVARNFYGESLFIAKTFHPTIFNEIDSIMKDVALFKMGPFELMDLIGIDINYAVTQSVWKSFYFHPRFQPHPLQKMMVDSKKLGKKTESGFILGQKIPTKSDSVTFENNARRTPVILIEHEHPLLGKIERSEYNVLILEEGKEDGTNLEQYAQGLSSANLLIDLITSNTENKRKLLRELSHYYQGDIVTEMTTLWGEGIKTEFPQVKGGVSLSFFSPTKIYEYWSSSPEITQEILSLYSTLKVEGKSISNPGFGMFYPRIVSMIVNEAYMALEEGVANEEDIDLAMKFGVNYPLGPIEWGSKIGTKAIVNLLTDLQKETGLNRYEVSYALKIAALRGENA